MNNHLHSIYTFTQQKTTKFNISFYQILYTLTASQALFYAVLWVNL